MSTNKEMPAAWKAAAATTGSGGLYIQSPPVTTTGTLPTLNTVGWSGTGTATVGTGPTTASWTTTTAWTTYFTGPPEKITIDPTRIMAIPLFMGLAEDDDVVVMSQETLEAILRDQGVHIAFQPANDYFWGPDLTTGNAKARHIRIVDSLPFRCVVGAKSPKRVRKPASPATLGPKPQVRQVRFDPALPTGTSVSYVVHASADSNDWWKPGDRLINVKEL